MSLPLIGDIFIHPETGEAGELIEILKIVAPSNLYRVKYGNTVLAYWEDQLPKFYSPKSCPSHEPKGEDIVKPQRYNKIGKLECWDVILDQQMSFLEGNLLKYLWRYKEKNGVADLKKAKVYLEKLISEVEKNGKA